MFKVKNGSIPDGFQKKFQLISHDYFTKNSMYHFKESRFKQILLVKFADLFQCVNTPCSGEYTLQGLLLNMVKTEISNSSAQSFCIPLFVPKNIKNRLIKLENIVSFF